LFPFDIFSAVKDDRLDEELLLRVLLMLLAVLFCNGTSPSADDDVNDNSRPLGESNRADIDGLPLDILFRIVMRDDDVAERDGDDTKADTTTTSLEVVMDEREQQHVASSSISITAIGSLFLVRSDLAVTVVMVLFGCCCFIIENVIIVLCRSFWRIRVLLLRRI
jgi:hypothetical protein